MVGIKVNDVPTCSLTPWQIQAKGASFVTVPQSQITYGSIGAMSWWGVDVYARWASAFSAQQLIDLGPPACSSIARAKPSPGSIDRLRRQPSRAR